MLKRARVLTSVMDDYIRRYEVGCQCKRSRDLAADRPARTLTCRNLSSATSDMIRLRLPDGRRRLTVREAARLQSFPDWFRLHGTLIVSPADRPVVAAGALGKNNQASDPAVAEPLPGDDIDTAGLDRLRTRVLFQVRVGAPKEFAGRLVQGHRNIPKSGRPVATGQPTDSPPVIGLE